MSDSDLEFGLALGGGGARGIVHIHILEALDELGLKPKIISGTSIGALFGAAYASGLTGSEIKNYALEALGKRISILKKLFGYKPATLFQLWNVRELSKSLLNPELLLENIFPEAIKTDFKSLEIPLKIVATDYYKQRPVTFESGDVIPAVAASIALPAVFRPVTIKNTLYIDGGLTNPLPFDVIADDVEKVIAIDVTGGPVTNNPDRLPSMSEVLYTAVQIPQTTIVQEKIKQFQPTIFLHAPVDNFLALSFHKIKEILKETEEFKSHFKKEVEEKLVNPVSF